MADQEVQGVQGMEQETEAVQIPGAPPGVTMRAVWVTPEMATRWLAETQVRNRNRRGSVSDAYGRDMSVPGRWKLNGETIVFDKDHSILQGQHRLEGVVKGGNAVLLLLVEGIDVPGVMETYDTGLPRYYFDMLKVAGYVYPQATSSVTRGMWHWDRGRYMMNPPGGAERPSRAELDAYLEEHQDEIQAAAAYAERMSAAGVPLPVSVLGTAVIILDRIDSAATGEFFNSLTYGAGLGQDNPILVLRNQLSRSKGQRKLSTDERRALLFGTWNAWRAGETRDKIQPWRGPLSTRNYPIPK